jgi:hypothetical protein
MIPATTRAAQKMPIPAIWRVNSFISGLLQLPEQMYPDTGSGALVIAHAHELLEWQSKRQYPSDSDSIVQGIT